MKLLLPLLLVTLIMTSITACNVVLWKGQRYEFND